MLVDFSSSVDVVLIFLLVDRFCSKCLSIISIVVVMLIVVWLGVKVISVVLVVINVIVSVSVVFWLC